MTAALASKGDPSALKITEYTLQQIVFVVPSGLVRRTRSRSAGARPRPSASASRGCDQSLAQAKPLRGVVVKDIGRRDITPAQRPAGRRRSGKTPAGKTAPPNQTDQGIELIAVCATPRHPEHRGRPRRGRERALPQAGRRISARTTSRNCATAPSSSTAEAGMAGEHARRSPPSPLTMGEPAGIGPDVTLAAWVTAQRTSVCRPSTASPIRRSSPNAPGCSASIARSKSSTPAEARVVFAHALPVVPLDAHGQGDRRQARPRQRPGGHRGDRARRRRCPRRPRRRRSSPTRSPRRRSTTPASAIPATPSFWARFRRHGPARRRAR